MTPNRVQSEAAAEFAEAAYHQAEVAAEEHDLDDVPTGKAFIAQLVRHNAVQSSPEWLAANTRWLEDWRDEPEAFRWHPPAMTAHYLCHAHTTGRRLRCALGRHDGREHMDASMVWWLA